MSIFNNSIWPNKDGQLGETKVAIPDGVTTTWPEGDVLVGDFVFNNDGDLTGLIDSQALIANSSGSTTFPYDYVEINLPSIAEGAMTFNQGERCKYLIVDGVDLSVFKYKGCKTVNDVTSVDANYQNSDIVNGVWDERLDNLTDGEYMFNNCRNLTSFSSDLSSLTDGWSMFYDCIALSTFSSDLSSLTNGFAMFYNANFTSFSSDLSSLTYGRNMFEYCSKLTSFSSDLSNLTDGQFMFYGSGLESFSSDLSSLTNGGRMFLECSKLTSFSSDLSNIEYGAYMFQSNTALTSFYSNMSSLINGGEMFYGCSKLNSFYSDLRNLTDGEYMFYDCKLDTASVENIANTIKDVNGVTNNMWVNKKIHIGIGQESSPTAAEEIYFQQIRDKGWEVYVECNGGISNCCASCCATCCASLTTLDETDGEFVAPKPYWAKPVPATEDTARYIDNDGNYYNILGGDYIYVHDPETYGMFTSLEDAQAQMRLTKFTKGEEPVIIETA